MSKSTNNLQDIFLNGARKNKIPVTIHLTNGFQIKGTVSGFDSFTVVLNVATNGDSRQQMLIYKHAVSTITPLKPILFNNPSEQTEE